MQLMCYYHMRTVVVTVTEPSVPWAR